MTLLTVSLLIDGLILLVNSPALVKNEKKPFVLVQTPRTRMDVPALGAERAAPPIGRETQPGAGSRGGWVGGGCDSPEALRVLSAGGGPCVPEAANVLLPVRLTSVHRCVPRCVVRGVHADVWGPHQANPARACM